jgi:hypothetical protein
MGHVNHAFWPEGNRLPNTCLVTILSTWSGLQSDKVSFQSFPNVLCLFCKICTAFMHMFKGTNGQVYYQQSTSLFMTFSLEDITFSFLYSYFWKGFSNHVAEHRCVFARSSRLDPWCHFHFWNSCKQIHQFITLFVNTLTSSHVERRDCSPMRCWRVTHLYVFLHDSLHMRLSADVIHLGRELTILTSRELMLCYECSWGYLTLNSGADSHFCQLCLRHVIW